MTHMPQKLWQKTNANLHPLAEAYTVGDDYIVDQELLPFDVAASKAHARMLAHINILTQQEYEAAAGALKKLMNDWNAGDLTITVQDEDCHTVIENYLVKTVGDVGKK